MKTGHSKIETGHLPANDGKTGQHRSKHASAILQSNQKANRPWQSALTGSERGEESNR